MPIYGLSDVPQSFLKLGQIRKGAPKGGNAPGKDLDYFRVTFLNNIVTIKGKAVNVGLLLQERFKEVYGDKPVSINARFADSSVIDVWDVNFECYKQGGLYAKAGSNKNGAYWIYYRDVDTAEVLISDGIARNSRGADLRDEPVDLTKPIYHNMKKEPFFLEPVGRLKVVIPELADIAVGYFEFRPESPRDIRNISAELAAFDAVAKQYGKTIAGVPFILRRREEEVSKKIDGKLVAGKSWVVHLDVGGDWGVRALDVIERLALPEIIEAEVKDVTQNAPDWEGTPEEWDQPEQEAGTTNPDPIDDKAWKAWTDLTERATKQSLKFPKVDRARTTKADLRIQYRETESYVKDAESQAQAA